MDDPSFASVRIFIFRKGCDLIIGKKFWSAPAFYLIIYNFVWIVFCMNIYDVTYCRNLLLHPDVCIALFCTRFQFLIDFKVRLLKTLIQSQFMKTVSFSSGFPLFTWLIPRFELRMLECFTVGLNILPVSDPIALPC